MIKILNDLPSFCEDCPYTNLVFKEKLGSGINAYTCKFLHICERVYNKTLNEEGLSYADQDTLTPAT